MSITNLIGRLKGGPTTAAALRELLGQLDLPAAERAVEELAAARRAALLEATDAELAKVEERLTQATRDRDRTVAARQELESRLKAAEEAEAAAALDAQIAATEKRAQSAAATLRKAMEKHGAPIVAALAEVAAAAAEVSTLNRSLPGQNRPMLDSLERRLDRLFWPTSNITPPSVLVTTSIPPVGECQGWGQAQEIHYMFNGQPAHVREAHQQMFGMPNGPARGF